MSAAGNPVAPPIAFRCLVLCALFAALPVVAVFMSKGTALLVSVAAPLAMLFDAELRALVGQALRRPPKPVLACLPLLAWSALSLVWTVELPKGIETFAVLIYLLGAALVLITAARNLSEADRARLRLVMAASGAAFVLLFGFEIATHGLLTSFFRNAPRQHNDYLVYLYPAGAILAVCAWPYVAAAAVRMGGRLAGLLGAGILVVCACSFSSAPPVALLVSMAAALIVWRWRRRGVAALGVGLMLWLMVAPFAMHAVFAAQDRETQTVNRAWHFQHRTLIWRFADKRILERPVIGWGFSGSRSIPGGHELVPNVDAAELLPLHPHNAFLQIWLELGGVGAVLAALFYGSLLRAIARLGSERCALAMLSGGFATYLAVGQLSHGIWQTWWLSTAIVAMAGAAAAIAKPVEPVLDQTPSTILPGDLP